MMSRPWCSLLGRSDQRDPALVAAFIFKLRRSFTVPSLKWSSLLTLHCIISNLSPEGLYFLNIPKESSHRRCGFFVAPLERMLRSVVPGHVAPPTDRNVLIVGAEKRARVSPDRSGLVRSHRCIPLHVTHIISPPWSSEMSQALSFFPLHSYIVLDFIISC